MTCFIWHAWGHILLVSEAGWQRQHSQTRACRRREDAAYNRFVSRSLCETGTKRYRHRGCVRVGGGAEIPPEPQLTQTQRNIASRQTCSAWLQLWHNFTGFGTSILPKYRPLARSQRRSWSSVISAQNKAAEIPVRALRSDQRTIPLRAG